MSHQLPSEVRRLADEHRLGELEAVHLQRGLRSLLLVIASILVLLAVLVVVSAFLYPGTDSSLPSLEYHQQDLVPPLLLAFFVVLLAVGAMRLRQVMRRRAYVYSEGFVATDEGPGETAVRWDEIDNLWLDVNGVNPHFAVTYLDESGKPRRTYRFRVNTLRNWGFAGPLRRRCVLEMERRGWHRHPVDALRRSGHTVYIWATDEWFKEEPEDDGDSDETSAGP